MTRAVPMGMKMGDTWRSITYMKDIFTCAVA